MTFGWEIVEKGKDDHVIHHGSLDVVLDEGDEVVIWGEGEDYWREWGVECGRGEVGYQWWYEQWSRSLPFWNFDWREGGCGARCLWIE